MNIGLELSKNKIQKNKLICIIKVTNNCNLNCPYCYHKEHINSDILSHDIFEKFLNSLYDYEELEITFHGGEPLLVGLDWYKKTIKIIDNFKMRSKNLKKIVLNMQSNGTLLDEEIILFFKENHIQIGLSFDGIDNEKTRTQTNTFLKNINLLKKNGLVTGAICIITKDNCDKIIDNYNYTELLGLHSVFNIVHNTPDMYNNLNDISFDKLFNNMIKFFNYYVSNPMISPINLFDIIISNISGSKIRINKCVDIICCYKWISMTPTGDLYPCGKNWQDNYMMGNIQYISVKEAFRSNEYNKYVNDIKQYMTECSTCDYFKACMGGCPNERLANSGSLLKPDVNHCEMTKALYDYIYQYIVVDKKKIVNKHVLRIMEG